VAFDEGLGYFLDWFKERYSESHKVPLS
jgi:hypothetical protein